MTWHTYSLPPIDRTWGHLKTVAETLKEMAFPCDKEMADFDTMMKFAATPEFHNVQTFLRAWESAKDAARDAGWEGDFRMEPSVFWVPMEEFEYGFAFKQNNNGITFVISPIALPWLVGRRAF